MSGNVAEPADQGTPILVPDRDVVIVADEPPQDSRGGIGAVLLVTAQTPLVRSRDFRLNLVPA